MLTTLSVYLNNGHSGDNIRNLVATHSALQHFVWYGRASGKSLVGCGETSMELSLLLAPFLSKFKYGTLFM